MPRLEPFRPVHYAAAPGADLSSRIAPPYDVLDDGPKRALLARDPHNIVAVDLPVTPPKTVGPDSAYTAAGDLFRAWQDKGILIQEERPCVLAYEQVFSAQDRHFQRRGLFTTLGLEDFNRPGGGIFRHEKTIAGGIGDRSKLMATTNAQLSPVFGLFSDPGQVVASLLNPIMDSTDADFTATTSHDQVLHRCWLLHDPALIQQLQAFFEPTDVFIADGHHRYTTALAHARAHPHLTAAQTGLFVLVAAEDPGMIVLPTHRVVQGFDRLTLTGLEKVLSEHPQLERTAPEEARFALYEPVSGQTLGVNVLGDPLATRYPDRPEVWRNLDVAVLHAWLLEEVLQPAFAGNAATNDHYLYTADLSVMHQLAQAGPGRLGIRLRATPLASVMAVSHANEVMPPKSTFFFPKLATGLAIHPLGT